jgi:cold shock CspA family protein
VRGRVTISEYGYAFIDCFENGAEYFVAPADIKSGATLTAGQLVEFAVEFHRIRGLYAANVTPVEAA